MTLNQFVHKSQHPIVATKLSQLRDKDQSSKTVRELTHDLSLLLGYEASFNIELKQGPQLFSGYGTYSSMEIRQKVGLVPVLRSGLSFVEGFLNLFPEAPVYHLGIYREKISHQPVEYYNNLPDKPDIDICYVLDPVIATGNTAVATVNMLKDWGLLGSQIKFVTMVASEQGLAQLQKEHDDIHIYLAAIDKALDSNGYINPGIGDSGNRLWNTI
ncbi:uracil phosphoribosyltransferase-domain-containing protein [Cokeromyces recurvatus]|uniref:uracil phosphoribosyltransferase-domain-containing protein n=1 Tax=Cokeromyces recurvatus TaxID=90255 RepID=UPI00221FDEFE|nr:uracil phosphoribosyltransferase-domain-containing protein [Cokeromyces recurvatus]KAI7903669.1 uracil phosphoribosyltransferase-domain-containing protein [Cokeromyces recurvatus]